MHQGALALPALAAALDAAGSTLSTFSTLGSSQVPVMWNSRVLAAATGRLDAYERNPSAAGIAILKRAIWSEADPRGMIPSRQDPHSVARAALIDFHDAYIVPNGATL